jgi:hypothetical protein
VDPESIAMGKESVSNSTPSGKMLSKDDAFELIITGRLVRHSASLSLVLCATGLPGHCRMSSDSGSGMTGGSSTVVS